jgi:hypothetical protein
MWLSAEMWDSQARQAIDTGALYKGAKLSGMGTLIHNKWTDKVTGEDRKMLKVTQCGTL